MIGRSSSFRDSDEQKTEGYRVDYLKTIIRDVKKASKNFERNIAGIAHYTMNFRDYVCEVSEENRIKLNEEMAKATLNLPYCLLDD